MDDRIGISLATLLPWSAFPCAEPLAKFLALPIAKAITKQIGASFWQVLPLKGVTAKGLERTGIPVRYAERLGATTMWRRLFRGEGNWLEVALFPKPDSCEQRFQEILRMPTTIGIDHDLAGLNKSLLVEVSPGLGKTTIELAQLAREIGRKPYVLDTRHSRTLGRWEQVLETLLPYTALVHVQPQDGKELQSSLNDEFTDMVRMLMNTWSLFHGPFVVEIHPAILGISSPYFWQPSQRVRTLRSVIEIIKAYA